MRKYIIVIALAATSVGFAQSSSKESKQERTTKTEKAQEALKHAEEGKSLKDAKKIEREYTELEKAELKAAAKLAKTAAKEEAVKVKKAEKASKVQSGLKQEASEIKAPSEKTLKAKRDKAVNASGLKGVKLGKARASEAKQMIELKEIEMTTNDVYIEESRRRISIAKNSLQDQITAGSLSEEEIVSKKSIVAKAEARLANYEANVKNSKLALRAQKNKIINLYDKQ